MKQNNTFNAIVFLMVLLVIALPLAVIWAWNTLFGTLHTIPYSVSTWFAVVIIGGFLQAKVRVDK